MYISGYRIVLPLDARLVLGSLIDQSVLFSLCQHSRSSPATCVQCEAWLDPQLLFQNNVFYTFSIWMDSVIELPRLSQ